MAQKDISATIRVYKDVACNLTLDEVKQKLPYWNEEDDYAFGSNSWDSYLDSIEKIYPKRWEAVVIAYRNGEGRCFYRSKHYLKNKAAKIQWLYVSRLYIFDCPDPKALNRIFSGFLIYRLNLNKLDRCDAFVIGRDEYLLRMIKPILAINRESYNRVTVVLNASPARLVMLMLTVSLKRVVWMRSKKDVLALRGMYDSLRSLYELFAHIDLALRIAKRHKLAPVNYIKQAFAHTLRETKRISERFEKMFCH